MNDAQTEKNQRLKEEEAELTAAVSMKEVKENDLQQRLAQVAEEERSTFEQLDAERNVKLEMVEANQRLRIEIANKEKTKASLAEHNGIRRRELDRVLALDDQLRDFLGARPSLAPPLNGQLI